MHCFATAVLAVVLLLFPSPGTCTNLEEALNRKIEFYPAGKLDDVISRLEELSGVEMELADLADGTMVVRPSYTDNMVLREGLTKHLARVGVTWEVKGEKILIKPTERYARHKKAETRLKELGVTVTRISEEGRLGVQDYSAEFTWWTHVEVRDKWKGMGDEFGLIQNLIDVTQLQLINADAARDALQQLRDLRPTTLVIVNCDIRDDDMRHLSGMKDLWHLQLEGLNIRGEGLKHIVGADELRWLSLAYCPVDDNQLKHVKAFKSLQGLRLANTPVGDAGLAHLDGLRDLEHLNLEGTAVTDIGIDQLKGLKRLSRLDLDKTHITDQGLARLTEIKPELRVLQCGWTLVTDVGMKSLSKMRNLSTLSVEKTTVSAAGLREIVRAENICSISIHGLDVGDLSAFARPEGKPALSLWAKPQVGEMRDTSRPILLPSSNPWSALTFRHEPTDLERIQGQWVSPKSAKAFYVTDFTGMVTSNRGIDSGGTLLNFAFELDATAMPKTIRLYYWNEGGKEFSVSRGIYRFDHDRLVIYYGDGKEFPKRFPKNEDAYVHQRYKP